MKALPSLSGALAFQNQKLVAATQETDRVFQEAQIRFEEGLAALEREKGALRQRLTLVQGRNFEQESSQQNEEKLLQKRIEEQTASLLERGGVLRELCAQTRVSISALQTIGANCAEIRNYITGMVYPPDCSWMSTMSSAILENYPPVWIYRNIAYQAPAQIEKVFTQYPESL